VDCHGNTVNKNLKKYYIVKEYNALPMGLENTMANNNSIKLFRVDLLSMTKL
jgi:hypothetical protein